MTDKIFRINLMQAHNDSNLTAYMIAKKLRENGFKISKATVNRYAFSVIYQKELTEAVLHLCEFYGVDWRDPAIVDVVEEIPA